jgi:TRAP-type mannitol/chloroaromatic compound transport system substrate-binding protein
MAFKTKTVISALVSLILAPASAHPFDASTCPTTPNVHFQVRSDAAYFGADSAEFVTSRLSQVIGATPVIVDAGSGTPTVAGVGAACDKKGCFAGGAHFAIVIPGTGNALGSNHVGDFFTSDLPFGLSAEEHHAWLWEAGGLALEQRLYDGLDRHEASSEVRVVPIVMTAPEHGLWWRDDLLPLRDGIRSLPDSFSEALEILAGQKLRFFGNGGKLMVSCLGVSNAVTGGVTPYNLMKSQEVVGTDFSTAAGDLEVFIVRPGTDILKAASTPDPAGPISGFGYKTFYADGWHQEYDVLELLVDTDYYENCLTPGQRSALYAAGKSFMQESRQSDVDANDQALDAIRAHLESVGGSYHATAWPQAILDELKGCASTYFSDAASADPSFRRVFKSVNGYKAYDPQAE